MLFAQMAKIDLTEELHNPFDIKRLSEHCNEKIRTRARCAP